MLQWWEEFSRRPLVAHVLRTVERFNLRGGGQFAAAITYFSVLSIVPVLMLAFSVLGLTLTVLRPDALDAIEKLISDNLQSNALLGDRLVEVVNSALSNWAAIGLVGLGIAVWTGANWLGNLKRAVRTVMRSDVDNPGKQLPLPLEVLVNFGGLIGVLVGVAATFVATATATSLGTLVGDYLGIGGSFSWSALLRVVSLLLSLAAGTVLFWWLFAWFAPEPVPRHLLWVGAMVGAAALVVLQSLAGLLVGLFSGNLSAGIFGSVIVLMLFLNLFATLILYVAAWLATSRAPVPQALAEVETVSEPEPVALVEGRPGDLYVSSEVAQRSLGIGLTTGYAVGAATGVGIGALLVAGIRAVFGRKRA
ncbi:MAG TPA: YhjD/YihY/BrkB family envelope integrity protein [Propionicimonas sp.]|jgi:membrane protein|nr:YhjD/YihY/BrkB family envelope integrity protein [Propionicimonas sp.]